MGGGERRRERKKGEGGRGGVGVEEKEMIHGKTRE